MCIPPHRSSNPEELDKLLFAGIIYAKRVYNSPTESNPFHLIGNGRPGPLGSRSGMLVFLRKTRTVSGTFFLNFEKADQLCISVILLFNGQLYFYNWKLHDSSKVTAVWTISTNLNSTNFTTQFTTSTTVTANDTVFAKCVIKDADGNTYTEVTIGTQTWMVENLRTATLNDRTAITLNTGSTTWADTTARYCYYNNTINSDSIKKFGALYNWYTVNTGKLVPSGWHVPSYSEWTTLQNYLINAGYNYDGTTSDNKIAKSLLAKTGCNFI
jgi:uncharacterized protein (TIGR02145 family)